MCSQECITVLLMDGVARDTKSGTVHAWTLPLEAYEDGLDSNTQNIYRRVGLPMKKIRVVRARHSEFSPWVPKR